jgi:hypothetical protein
MKSLRENEIHNERKICRYILNSVRRQLRPAKTQGCLEDKRAPEFDASGTFTVKKSNGSLATASGDHREQWRRGL